MKHYFPLIIIGFFSGILFILLDSVIGRFPFNFIIKPVPIWCIAYFCFLQRNYLLTLGLLMGSIGDILLTQEGETFFLFGLLSFLIGHILYALYFLTNFKINKQSVYLSIFVLVLALGISFFIIPNIEKKLYIPIIFYITMITIMTLSTLFYKNFNYYSFLGAVLFLISDTLIAINKFISPIPYAQIGIMFLYYLGQWGIGYGGCKKSLT